MAGVLIVTGGGRGIGAAIAREASRHGYKVCVNYSQSREKAETIAGEIREAGGQAIAYQADVAEEAQVVAMFEEVDRALGPVTAMVNNAGIDYTTHTGDVGVDGISRVFAVNVTGAFLCARESIRRMSTARGGLGGVIVNISSVSPKTGGMPGDVVYTASKGAMDAFTIALAKEVGGEGIRVCAVRPGITETEIFDTNVGLDAVKEMARKTVPLGRIGQPEEIATMTLWLCSEEASYVTGTLFDVSGGR